MRKLALVLVAVLTAGLGHAQTFGPDGSLQEFVPDAIKSGTLGALNATVAVDLAGRHGAGVYITTANLNAIVTPECSPNGSVWFASAFVSGAGAVASTLTFGGGADSQFHGISVLPGCQSVRARISTYTSGTSSARMVATASSGMFIRAIQVGSLTVVGSGTFAVTQSTSPWVVSNGGTFAVQAAQSGTWTVQPGNTANTTPWLATISQGGNAATVTGANALKVDGSAVTQPVSGTVTTTPPANASTNVAQFGGSAVVTGTGTSGAGIPRTTVSSDSSITANAGTNLNTSALLTTAAHDAAFGTAGAADTQVRTIQGIASMTPVSVTGTVTASPGSTISAANSRATSSLGSGGVFTGTYEDVTAYSGVSVSLVDVGASGGTLDLQWSEDGVTVRQTDSKTSGSSFEANTSVPRRWKFVRTVYTHGLSAGNVTITTSYHGVVPPETTPITFTGSSTTATPLVRVTSDSSMTITSVLPGTTSTSLGKKEDDPAANSDTGVYSLTVRQDTPASSTTTDGDYQSFKTDSIGRLWVNSSGVTQPVSGTVSVDNITNSVTPGTGATNLGKAEDAVAANADVGVAAYTVRQDTLASNAADGDYQPTKSDAVGAIYVAPDRYLGAATGPANAIHTRVAEGTAATATWTSATTINTTLSLDPTGYTHIHATLACTGTVTGGQVTWVRNDTNVQAVVFGHRTYTAAGADRTIASTTAVFATGCTEEWYITAAGASSLVGAVLSAVVTGTGSVALRLTPVTMQPTYVETVSASWLGSTAPTVGQKTMANSIPMVIASDQSALPVGNVATIGTSVTPGTGATNLGKAEDAGAASGDTGVAWLAQRKDTNSTLTSADADYVVPAADNYGVLSVSGRHPNAIRCTVQVSTAVVITAVGGSCAAPGAGLSIYVTDILFQTSVTGVAADSFPTLKYGTGATCGTGTTIFWGGIGTTNQQSFQTPLKIPANNAICWIATTAASKFINISGFIAP